MPAPANLDWLFTTLGWLLAVGGGALLLWALFWDRARGRRRCPKCWYDMAGAPSLRCSECGYDARSTGCLDRTRRRWGSAAVGAIIVLAGIATAETISVRRAGWVGAIPTWALAYWAPTSEPPGAVLRPASAGLSPRGVPASVAIGPGTLAVSGEVYYDTRTGDFVLGPGGTYTLGTAPPVTVPPRQSATITLTGTATPGRWPLLDPRGVVLHREMWTRLNNGTAWAWASRVYVRRILADHPQARPASILVIPDHWPVDERVPFLCRGGAFAVEARLRQGNRTGPWSGLGTAPATGFGNPIRAMNNPGFSGPLDVDVRFIAARKTVYQETLRGACEVGGSRDTFLGRLESPDATGQVRAALQPRLIRRGSGNFAIAFRDRDGSPQWSAIDFGVFFTTELRAGGRVLARCVGRAEWARPVWKTSESSSLVWTDEPVDLAALLQAGAVEVVIRGDPAAAAALFLERPFEFPSATCWAGEIVLKVDAADLRPLGVGESSP